MVNFNKEKYYVKCETQIFFEKGSYVAQSGLLNSWAQEILLPQSPK